jgi:hypothetical protein
MRLTTCIVIFVASLVAASAPAFAHCDTYDGPVVKAGQQALDRNDLDLAVIWIKPDAETELRTAFKQALAVRGLSNEARELADRFFLETLVRLHRAGEGEPYTGIKPKGTPTAPAVAAADTAIQKGSTRSLVKLLTEMSSATLQQRLDRVLATRKYKAGDVHAGREYVEAYVAFVEAAERMYDAAAGAASETH